MFLVGRGTCVIAFPKDREDFGQDIVWASQGAGTHFPLAISTIERPRDQMSALTVYEVNESSTLFNDEEPLIRSG